MTSSRLRPRWSIGCALLLYAVAPVPASEMPGFARHVEAVFSRLGCNGGTCHGAVKGQGAFRLSLFGADPALDHERLLREGSGRRLNLLDPDASLLLLKPTGRVSHQGGKRMEVGSTEYDILRRWILAGAAKEPLERSRVKHLAVRPALQTLKAGQSYRLVVEATFADSTTEDVTRLCAFESRDTGVATVASDGTVTARGAGDAALLVRFGAEPALAMVVVPRQSNDAFPEVQPQNFIDTHVLAKLRRLGIPPTGLADDATFLRRVTLDVTGQLPTSSEVRDFLADTSPDKRAKLIDRLLARPGYAALWTLKFCDLLKANDFGVYADGIRQEVDAPRFQSWVRTRLEENIPYDEFAERILTATSRDGQSIETWAKEIAAMEDGYGPGRKDLDMYRRRKTLDLYWQRNSSTGVSAALQVAHAFLGLRMECAQCHRHPHDVWQQDDLLAFANFFSRVRKVGFEGDNEKKYPEVAVVFKRMNEEAKTLTEQAKKLRGSEEFKKLSTTSKTAEREVARLTRELTKFEKEAEKHASKITEMKKALQPHEAALAKFTEMQKRLNDMERRGRMLPEAARRVMHSEVRLLEAGKRFATVTSPLGTQTSKRYRLLGQSNDVEVAKDSDPRQLVMDWLRRPENPYFARAIVNRVWAHYFGRGIVDPPDNLSSFNPPTHPELLQELCDRFVQNKYDLKWLHRAILNSRTYQQDSTASPANEFDRANYAYFAYRRLPAEVLLDAINQATATSEKMGMEYYYWPAETRTVEVPYMPRNEFVRFTLETFGKPKRNSAVQCDCERDGTASVLQVLALANHPHVWAKIGDEKGQVARIVKEISGDERRIEELFLVALGRLPSDEERGACRKYLQAAESGQKGLQGLMWGLLNTKEFLLQH
jgi:hypothetical protein